MSDIQTWSNTAASNNATPPNGFPEGMAPSTVNDAARELMAAVSRYRSDTDGVNTSAGTNTITLAASRTMTAYAQGDLYTFKAGGTNTGATTLNVDSLGAKDVQFNGAACTGGEIVSGLMYTVVYDGTQFQLLNASSYPAIDITTLEVTNIKAKDGTASMTIANSTGNVSAGTITTAILNTANAQISGGNIDGADLGAISQITTASIDVAVINTATIPTLNSTTVDTTNIEATNIKAKDGTASFAIADSTGIASFSKATIIATTDNTNAALRVTQLGTANALEIEDTTNPDSSPFIVDANGNLIKGYTTAVPTVGITAVAYTPGIQGHLSGSIRGDVGLYTWGGNASFANTLNFSRSNNASIGTYTAVTSGTNLGDILWCGADGNTTGTEFAPAVRISGRCGGTVADGSVPGSLYISITGASEVAPTVRMMIDSQGFVGIGDAFLTPAKLLDIAGNNTGLTSADPVNTLRFTDTDTTTAANQPIGKIEFYNSDTGNAAVGAYILSSAVGASGGGTIRFGAAADAGTVAEVARIASTGLTVTLDTAGLGYGTGTGGTVTQATSRTTGVTLNKTNGSITLVSAAGTATWQSFTVTNNTVAATDVVILSQRSGTDLYMLEVTAVAAGSFRISFATTGGTTTEQPVFNFAVIKAVTS